jgi:hypothetical protein
MPDTAHVPQANHFRLLTHAGKKLFPQHSRGKRFKQTSSKTVDHKSG